MTLREKRYRDVTNSLVRTAAQRDACLANLVRYETRLKSLRRQSQRLERAMASPPKPAPRPEPTKVEPLPAVLVAEYKATADDLEVPGFLRRVKAANNKDAEIAATIRQEQADKKQAKARGRIEKMKAKQRGDTKRMPLSGRDALAAINQN